MRIVGNMRREAMEIMFYHSVARLKQQYGVNLKARGACHMREQYNDLFTNTKDYTGTKIMSERLNEIFRQYTNGADLWPLADNGETNDDFKNYMNSFYRSTGWTNDYLKNPYDCYLPVSPYDPRFSGRSAVRHSGTSLLYIADGDMPIEEQKLRDGSTVIVANSNNLSEMSPDSHMLKAPFYVRRKHGDLYLIESFNMPGGEKANVLMPDDFSGISRLMPYMSRADYTKVYHHVNDVGMTEDGQGGVTYNPDRYSDSESLDKAEAILRYLQDNGYSYSVVPDAMPGQIKAKVQGTHAEIRLLDPANPNYVGRVYDDGAFINCSKRSFAKDGKPVAYNPTVDEVVTTVRVALGEVVPTAFQIDDRGLSHYERFHKRAYESTGSSLDDEHMQFTAKAMEGAKFREKSGKDQPNGYFHGNQSFSKPLYVVQDFQNSGSFSGYANSVVRVRFDTKNRTNPNAQFVDEEDAKKFIDRAVDSARSNFANDVAIEDIYKDAMEHKNDPDYRPALSRSNLDIAALQLGYYNYFAGETSHLVLPGFHQENVQAYLEASDDDTDDYVQQLEDRTYTGVDYEGNGDDRLAIAKMHLQDSMDLYIGRSEPFYNERLSMIRGDEEKSFNPSYVIDYMQSEQNIHANINQLAAAIKAAHVDTDKLVISNDHGISVMDKLVEFDPETGQEFMCDDARPFVKAIYGVIQDSIKDNGALVKRDKDTGKPLIFMDDKGVIQYQATYNTNESSDKTRDITGTIGQVFVPDEEKCGAVTTQFVSGTSNYMFVPGYEAYVLQQQPGETKSFEERIRFKGYLQTMADSIRYTMRNDMTSQPSPDGEVGAATSLNRTYRRLYSVHHPVDYFDKTRQEGMTDEYREAILRDEASHVTFDMDFAEKSSIHRVYQEKVRNSEGYSSVDNDHIVDPFVLTDGHNMGVVNAVRTDESGERYVEESKLFADVVATGKSQIKKRTFKEGVTVDENGVAHPPENGSGLSPLMAYEAKKEGSFQLLVPADRMAMVNNVGLYSRRKAGDVQNGDRPVHVAQMACGGWNFEDGIPISKEMAEANLVHDSITGQMRPLTVGDKLCDRSGNKQLISIVVDRDMPMEEAKSKHIDKLVQVFKDNPELDAIAAPFSPVSRFNGGTARELMQHTSDLILRNDKGEPEVHKGCMGECVFSVAKQTVDTKVKLYDTDGRKVSSQNTMAMNSKNANEMLRYFYSGNLDAARDFREILIVSGFDMSETGKLHKGYHAHNGEDRRLFALPDGIGDLNPSTLRRDFGERIGRCGGFLELPFDLKMPSGTGLPVIKTEAVPDEKGDTTYQKTVMSADNEGNYDHDENSTYALPVLSSYLRSGYSSADDKMITHDYTMSYQKIFSSAVYYKADQMSVDILQKQIDGETDLSKVAELQDKIAGRQAHMKEMQKSAQSAFSAMTDEIKERHFDTKHNDARDRLLSVETPDSATAVMVPDPTLPLDAISMGKSLSDHITTKSFRMTDEAYKANSDSSHHYAFVVRPPVMKDSNQRCQRVVMNGDQNCFGVNPTVVVCLRGDFDGDTLGAHKIKSPSAQAECYDAFSFKANMLDRAIADDNGDSPLSINVALDIKVAEHDDPTIKDKFDDITKRLNEIEKAGCQRGGGSIQTASSGDEELWRQREQVYSELNDVVQDAFDKSFGKAVLSYADPCAHLTSVWKACIETGAKGSEGKFNDYAKWFGIATSDNTPVSEEICRLMPYYDTVSQTYDYDKMKADGVESKLTDVVYLDEYGIARNPLITPEMNVDTETATDIKSEGTGTAGTFSNNGIAALRNKCPDAVTMDTEVVTQSNLQAKHDPVAAIRNYGILTYAAKKHWQGYALEPVDVVDKATGERSGEWRVKTDADGNEIKATREEWIETHSLMYTGRYKKGDAVIELSDNIPSLKVEINPAHTVAIADALSVTDKSDPSKRVMLNVETDARELYGTTIDRLAYAPRGTGFNELCKLVKEGKSLYDGFETIAPSAIRKNIELEREGRTDEFVPIVMKDTLASYDDQRHIRDTIGVTGSKQQETILAQRKNSSEKTNISTSNLISDDHDNQHGDASE